MCVCVCVCMVVVVGGCSPVSLFDPGGGCLFLSVSFIHFHFISYFRFFSHPFWKCMYVLVYYLFKFVLCGFVAYA